MKLPRRQFLHLAPAGAAALPGRVARCSGADLLCGRGDSYH
jgi:hypothetical protein